MEQQAEWIDKHAAAKSLNLSTRSILNLAHTGAIQSRREIDPIKNQVKVLLHAGDVERARHKRESRGEEAPRVKMQFVQGGEVLTQALTSIAERVTALPAANHSGVRLTEKLFLTLSEAAQLGFGIGYLRHLVDEGKLELLKGAGPRRSDVVRRKDLEKL